MSTIERKMESEEESTTFGVAARTLRTTTLLSSDLGTMADRRPSLGIGEVDKLTGADEYYVW